MAEPVEFCDSTRALCIFADRVGFRKGVYVSSKTKLNYHHAELLYYVLRARTLTAAAEALHISQPAVTKQLRSLEDSIGVQLFKKEGRRLVPTSEALLLVEEVGRTRASLASLNAIAGRLKTGVEGTLIVYAVPSFAEILIPVVINDFRNVYPHVHIDVKVENSWRIMDLAESQQIDIGLCHPFREMHEVQDETLARLDMVCVVRRDHRFAGKREMVLRDLRGTQFVNVEVTNEAGSAMKSAIVASGLERDIACTVSMASLACEVALNTGLAAIVDSLSAASFQARGLHVIHLPGLPTRKISLLRPKHRLSSVYSDFFASVANYRVDAILRSVG